jgi:hypothetical protein
MPAFQRAEASAMRSADDAQPNSIARLVTQAQRGAGAWTWPLVMCCVRLPILVSCFLVSLLIAQGLGNVEATNLAEGLTRFDLPIVADVLCLALLWRLTRRAGMRLRDLLCWSRKHLLRDLALGIGLFMFAYVALFAIEAGVAIATTSGSAQQAQAMQGLLASGAINPLGMGWQIGMSALLLPITTAVTEELVYRGYAQARLTALTGHPWLAVIITSLGFAAQHLAYGLTSAQGALAAVVGAGVAGALFGALYYLTRQRLVALILIHWQSNVISLGLAPILLTLLVR